MTPNPFNDLSVVVPIEKWAEFPRLEPRLKIQTAMAVTEKDLKRFWSRVAIGAADECWLWTGNIGKDGRGVFSIFWAQLKAHRVALYFSGGSVLIWFLNQTR